MLKIAPSLLQGPGRLAALAAILSFGGTGAALALTGLGLPFLLAAALGSAAVGLVLYPALRQQAPPAPATGPEPDQLSQVQAELQAYRDATAGMRHDLRGVLSPALMMSDRLLKHADPAVQRAGQAVVRSIERATDLLATNRETLHPQAATPRPDGAE